MLRILILSILYIWIAVSDVYAANPAIIFGADGMAKNLASGGIELSNGVRWLDMAVDPSAGAGVAAPLGSMGANSLTGTLYLKTGALDTNWEVVSVGVAGGSSPITTEGDLIVGDGTGSEARLPIGTTNYVLTSNGTTASWQAMPDGLELLGKGELITSNGTINGAFGACSDNEVLVWDSSEDSGLTCGVIGGGGASDLLPTLNKGDIFVGQDASSVATFTAAANGSILYYDNTQTFGLAALPIGTQGQVLTVGASSTLTFDAPPYLGLLGKGSIITSDGTTNGEFTACANGEILEYDSAQAAGIKCVTKPADSGPNIVVGASSGPAANPCNIPSISITTTGNPVMVIAQSASDSPTGSGGSYGGSIYTGAVSLERDGVTIYNGSVSTDIRTSVTWIDSVPAGTYTYDVTGGNTAAGGPTGGTIGCQFMQIKAVEIK